MAFRVVSAQPPTRKLDGDTAAERFRYELESLAGIDVDFLEANGANPADFLELAKDADAIMTSWGVRIDSNFISQLNNCRIIALASIGVDMVDIEAATQAGIVVTNTPDIFVEEVADHTMMLLLAAIRRAKQTDLFSNNGQWRQSRALMYQSRRIFGKTLGLFSFGNIARAVSRRAQSFGIRVIAHDPYIAETTMTALGVEPVSFDELLARSDYISLHPPGTQETHAVINQVSLRKTKPGMILVNTSRGSAVDEQSLASALDSGQVAAAGLDVLQQEPPQADNPLLNRDNVLLTGHSAPATDRMVPDTRRRVGREMALVLSGRWPMACVNPSVLEKTNLER
ncbi:MAG: C-terminal binding protein, partial [Pseudomonadota bacterium]